MFPSLQQWKNWTPLERATYVAQLATLGALVATVVFSYLTLRAANEAVAEARKAREEQAAFFIAEKVPELEIVEMGWDSGILVARVHNSGDSIAKSVKAAFAFHSSGNKPLALDPGDGFRDRTTTIEKGQTSSIPLFDADKLIKQKLGYLPKMVLLGDKIQPSVNGIGAIGLILTYTDIQGNKYTASGMGDFQPADEVKK